MYTSAVELAEFINNPNVTANHMIADIGILH